jgi:multisubunit Na+/H+ antiporter MnhB subunit
MIHDRAAFGGSIIAVGSIYMWLAYFPLRDREPWAWWVFAASGLMGFGSFLAYLGYGYLDKWHGIATAFLLPIYLIGLACSWRRLECGRRSLSCLLRRHNPRRPTIGEGLLILTGLGMTCAGLTILFVGATSVFVPQDLEFIGVGRAELNAVSDRLIPLIAHDRAGFGGGLATTGLIIAASVWCGQPSLSRWQVLLFSGAVGFGCAIGVHYFIGYTDFVHLAPAWLGLIVFLGGIIIHRRELAERA